MMVGWLGDVFRLITRDEGCPSPFLAIAGQATFNDVVDFRDCTALNAGRLLCMSVAYTEEGAGEKNCKNGFLGL